MPKARPLCRLWWLVGCFFFPWRRVARSADAAAVAEAQCRRRPRFECGGSVGVYCGGSLNHLRLILSVFILLGGGLFRLIFVSLGWSLQRGEWGLVVARKSVDRCFMLKGEVRLRMLWWVVVEVQARSPHRHSRTVTKLDGGVVVVNSLWVKGVAARPCRGYCATCVWLLRDLIVVVARS